MILFFLFLNPQFSLVLQLRYAVYVQSHGSMSVCNLMLKMQHCLMLCVLIFILFQSCMPKISQLLKSVHFFCSFLFVVGSDNYEHYSISLPAKDLQSPALYPVCLVISQNEWHFDFTDNSLAQMSLL